MRPRISVHPVPSSELLAATFLGCLIQHPTAAGTSLQHRSVQWRQTLQGSQCSWQLPRAVWCFLPVEGTPVGCRHPVVCLRLTLPLCFPCRYERVPDGMGAPGFPSSLQRQAVVCAHSRAQLVGIHCWRAEMALPDDAKLLVQRGPAGRALGNGRFWGEQCGLEALGHGRFWCVQCGLEVLVFAVWVGGQPGVWVRHSPGSERARPSPCPSFPSR